MANSALVTTLKALTVVSQVAMRLSPVPELYRAYRQHSLDAMPIAPIVALWVCNHLWLVYGYAADNIFPLLSVSVFGELMSVICIAVYAHGSSNRGYVTKAVGGSLLVIVPVSVYVVLVASGVIHQSKHQLAVVLGYLADVTSLALDIAPLEKFRRVLATRSADSIPIFISCAIWINCLLWLLNGIVDDDLFILVPNAVGLVLTAIPIALYVVYRPGRLEMKAEAIDVEIHAADAASVRARPAFQSISSPRPATTATPPLDTKLLAARD